MKKLRVNVGRAYDIIIERSIIKNASSYISEVSAAKRVVIVTDSNVGPIYANDLKENLTQDGFKTEIFTFPAGESSKHINTIYDMLCFFSNSGLTRSDLVVALGGGVTGDMAGFAASIFLRGIKFVQIPTSLLAQIDSSVGGKTGVDLPAGKNLCGSFWQPSLVLIDPDVIKTLPKRFFNDGMGEAIKYGCIKSKKLFDRLKNENVEDFFDDMIFECVDIKRCVVENDEKESGERMLLNFGHTLGHSLEKYHNFENISHGEAVGIGMLLVTKASEDQNITKEGATEEILYLLKKYNLPTFDDAPLQELIKGASSDKKSSGDKLNFIFLKEIGESLIYPIKNDEINEFFGCGG